MSSPAVTPPAKVEKPKDAQAQPAIAAPIGETYHDWYDKVLPSARRAYRQLALFCVFFLGGFGAWAFMAPIGGATLVDGQIIADGYNLKVNHRHGGALKTILVREGDHVEVGQILAEIDASESEANLEIHKLRKSTAEIRLARYRAEKADQAELTLPAALQEAVEQSAVLQSVFDSQKNELAARVAETRSAKQIYDSRIETAQNSLEDLSKVREARLKRIEDLKTEIEISDGLLDKGYTTRNRNYDLKRQLSVDEEQLETLMIQIDERRSQLAQTKEDKLRWVAQRTAGIASEIVALNGSRAEAYERILYLSDVVDKATVRAPESGHIIRAHVNTIGSSVAPGDPIFEILPESTSPVIEAKVGSRDIEAIKVGQKLDIKVPSQDRNRSLMLLKGEVTYISYDAIPVGTPPTPLYVVRGKLDPESLEDYGAIKTGTNVMVFFLTEPKNFIHYIVDPYLGIQDKAFTH
ncbi:HlyD family type I secretion periplasmic adaptor subunit [Labrenzia sp. CE80]|uniref:HlyD family type I secretion periplasmic adaptor subunit n=1 Tax=Labrenzia sp. CE80 TaxID=1788986 RepID=UPI00129BC290|nr:HlyD family type I secretion periplasmic adaptor subunit [Labrenzia sp. CE80]